MTGSHALVSALRLDLHAALATSILHKLFNAVEAFAGRMAYFLALMSTLEVSFADLTTVWCAFVTENICHQLFAAVAESCN